MNVERSVRLVAGALVLTSVALGYWVSSHWFLLTAFLGFGLFQSGITNWCPMAIVLQKLRMTD